MSFGSMLETLIIGPLKIIFEVVFQAVYEVVSNPGVCIIALSLVMNLLVLPLYRRADAVQEKQRDQEAALAPGISHIKKTFSGNERLMMLRTYYRQNHYSPLSAFKGSVSLLLEIPFFMAAYQFLSHLILLESASFGPIKNLGAPDQMLSIGSFTINVLPILMTLINFASAMIYLKRFPLKTKLRTYAIAVVFLVILYGSPAGLVFYWTLNNVFSLIKNVLIYIVGPKLKARRAGKEKAVSARKAKRLEKRAKRRAKRIPAEPDRRLFFLSGAFLTVLIGLYIPSVYLAESPQEFVDLGYYFNPTWFNISAFLYAAGFFLLWFGVFYWLAAPKGKVIFERILAVCAVLGTVNYMFFGTKLGIVTSQLSYEDGLAFETSEILLNAGVIVAVLIIVLILIKKRKKWIKFVLPVGIAVFVVMTGLNLYQVKTSIAEIASQENKERPEFTLSRTEPNVIVLFLDRAMGEYVPYYLQEKPEFAELFDGFTWYANTISFGGHTNMGSPPLMGGYEYTPVEMNRRSTELQKDKHNEAILLLPKLFMNEGYGVTVCDAPYANYSWITDLALFKDYPDIHAYITKGVFSNEELAETGIHNNLRNFFAFACMKTMPLEVQPLAYDDGNYLAAGGQSGLASQVQYDMSKAAGMDREFLDGYEVLVNLPNITTVNDGPGQYLFLCNDATHEPMMLEEPSYTPSAVIDNTEYDAAHQDRFTADGKTLIVETPKQMISYQANLGSLLQVGKWLQYMRDTGVYDNTRIIIVADHGFNLGQNPDRLFTRGQTTIDGEFYYPLLMVKDFNAKGFTISNDFMTNADVPYLAVNDLIDNPTNPFTGKPITVEEKYAHPQFVMTTKRYEPKAGVYQFPASGWVVIDGDMQDRDCWSFIDEEIILTEHKIPD